MANDFSQKSRKKYICEKCCFFSNNKTDYNKHIRTIKHSSVTMANGMANDSARNLAKNYENDNTIFQESCYQYTCECGKKYRHKSSLCKHKKTCGLTVESEYEQENLLSNTDNNAIVKSDLKDIVCKLMNENKDIKDCLLKENQELKRQLLEKDNQISSLIPKVGNNNTSNNTNNIKQRFNINIFLNEKCRDAISMDEFIEKIEVSMKDLLTTREKGLSEGLSNIIIDNMNKLSLYERPLHCTDKKRETLYIKEADWVKDENREKISQVLKKITNKQLKTIKKWIHENPNYNQDEKLKDEYIQLVTKCTESLDESERKLIKNICNNVYLENK